MSWERWKALLMLKKVNLQTLMAVYACFILTHLLSSDPEEFLNMLFKHTLEVDPFLTIRFVVENASFQ